MTIEKTIQKFDFIINEKIDFSQLHAPKLDNQQTTENLLKTYWEESKVILSLISNDLQNLQPEQRILEIGAGTGLVSHVLKNNGFKIDAIEPSSQAFSFMRVISTQLKSILETEGFLTCDIQDSTLERYKSENRYHLIFSSHVLEHVADIPACFKKINELSEKNGKSIHLCPNYIIPFEPHLGKWILPFAQKNNCRVFKKSYKLHKNIWDNINFITSGKVMRVAKKTGLKVKFDQNILQFYLRRYSESSMLRDRHETRMLSFIVSFLLRFKIYKLIPASLQSPMFFTLIKDPLKPHLK